MISKCFHILQTFTNHSQEKKWTLHFCLFRLICQTCTKTHCTLVCCLFIVINNRRKVTPAEAMNKGVQGGPSVTTMKCALVRSVQRAEVLLLKTAESLQNVQNLPSVQFKALWRTALANRIVFANFTQAAAACTMCTCCLY